MATKQEIRQMVGEDLSIVPIGQDLEAQDQAKIDTVYDQVYLRLKRKGLASWASTDEVPDELVPYFSLMIKEKLLTAYSVPDTRYNRIMLEAGPDGTTAMLKLAELSTPEYESTDTESNF